MKIGVTGASGLIGTPLCSSLRAGGHGVVRFVRGQVTGPDQRLWDPASRRMDPSSVEDLDAVIHLAGAGVGDKRWTASYKSTVLQSRVDGTTAVATAMADAQGPQVLLSASAIGWYGDTGDRLTDETGPRGQGFLADVCDQWEKAAGPAEAAGVRVAYLRTGIVLDPSGGALGKQLPIFRLGAGAPLGSGRQWTSWISLRDELSALAHCLTAAVSGPVNLVSPAPVTNREFTRTLGAVLHRPTLPIGVPALALRAGLGQFADEGLLTGQRLSPSVLDGSGFAFEDRELGPALRAMLPGR